MSGLVEHTFIFKTQSSIHFYLWAADFFSWLLSIATIEATWLVFGNAIFHCLSQY